MRVDFIMKTGTVGVFYQLLGKTRGLALDMKMSYTIPALASSGSLSDLLDLETARAYRCEATMIT